MASKGKSVATGKGSGGGKRKRGGNDDDKTGGGRKKRNREILQFFEDEADLDEYESDESYFNFSDIDDYVDEEFDIELKVKNEPARAQNLPFVPKEEEMDEEEFDKMMEERYKNNPIFGGYAEDSLEAKRSMERDLLLPSAKDPTIWKVKCMVGRERHSAFCLMQKFVDLKSLGTKLQIISAFAVDHVKGFIFIEAEKQCNINEACKALCSIYSSRVAPVPKNEVSHMLSIPSKHNQVTEGMWARVKNGKYKGDLAQIVAVNHARRRATVKLIPRIDLQAMAQKFGGGVAVKTAATPAPRLMSSSELEEFRPLIQYRHDRDSGKMFEVLDGLMLKDGYLYKRVSVDSLNCCGAVPTEEELLKFKPSENNESDNLEWLTQLYGGQKKKRIIGNDKGGEKGESSSGSGMHNSFEPYSLVCVGRKDFGLLVGMEKDDYCKILKHGPEAPAVVTVELHELKNGPSDMKFTALDHRMKIISINDTVRIMEGPSKDRQGIVKQIYRGIIFFYDQNETDNGGYFCAKAQLCEKIKLSFDASYEKGGDPGPLGFDDFLSSPKSPLSPKRQWQARENNPSQRDKNGIFSIGQTLRIRVGPLKGYLCNVLAVRYSDVTVKLGSQQKVLTVKSEHLSEVGGKSSAMPESNDPATSSFKPFDLLGGEGGSTGWTNGAGTAVEGDRWNTGGAGTSGDGDGWNAGGLSTESSFWPSVLASGSTPTEISLENPSSSAEPAWQGKATSNQNSAWGAATSDDKAVAKSEDGWNKAAVSSGASDGWGKATLASGGPTGSSRVSGGNWGQANFKVGNCSIDDAAAWDKGKKVNEKPTCSWGNAALVKNQVESWSKGSNSAEAGSYEKQSSSTGEDCWNNKSTGWNQQKSHESRDTWGKAVEVEGKDAVQERSWEKAVEAKGKDAVQEDSWGKAIEGQVKGAVQEDSWGKAIEGQVKGAVQEDSWGKAAEKWDGKGGSSDTKVEWKNSTNVSEKPTESWGSPGGSWNQPENKNADQTSGWMKARGDSASQSANWGSGKNVTEEVSGWTKGGSGNKDQTSTWNKSKASGIDGGSSWRKPQGESSWGKQEGGSLWSKPQGESSWGKQEGGSSWNEQGRDQDFGGWNKEQDGGYGSGGRRGRGGGWGGRGGRGQFGRGRSYGEGQSSNWKDGGNNWSSDGTSSRDPSGWSNDQAGSSWNKFENQGAGEKWGSKDGSSEGKAEWKSSSAKDKPTGGWGKSGGTRPEADNVDKTSGWMKVKDDSASQTANWGSAKNVNEDASGWTKGGSGNQDQTDTWNKPKAASGVDGGSSWGKPREASSWRKQDGGSSWSKPQGESSWGKQDGGPSWSKQDRDQDFGEWNKEQDGGYGSGGRRGRRGGGGRGGTGQYGRGRSYGEGQSSSWKGSGGNNWSSDGTSLRNPFGWSNDRAGSRWNKLENKGAGEKWGSKDGSSEGNAEWKSSSARDKPTEGWGNPGGSWNQSEADNVDKTSGWMIAKDDSASQTANWGSGKNIIEDASGWTKGDGSGNQDQTDTWNKPKATSGVDGGSSWSKPRGESSWGKQDGGSSWTKPQGESSWGKQDGGSSWSGPQGESSWGKKDGGSSWSKPLGESSWGKQDGGSSCSKPQGGSSWSNQDGGSSWNKQDRDRNFGGWNKEQDGVYGSGGRRGRRGSGWGGSGQYGRGRSYGEGHSSSWKDVGGNNRSSDGTASRNPSGWSNDRAGSSWNKFENKGAGEKCGGKDGSSEGNAEWKSSSATDKPTEYWGNSGRRWNQPEAENVDKTCGWMKAKDDRASQTANWGSGKNVTKDASGWTKGGYGNQDQTDTWNKPKAAAGVDEGSCWSKPQGESSWGKQEWGSSWGKQEGGSSWKKQDRDQV